MKKKKKKKENQKGIFGKINKIGKSLAKLIRK